LQAPLAVERFLLHRRTGPENACAKAAIHAKKLWRIDIERRHVGEYCESMVQPTLPGDSGREPYVVVAGFGLPGRSLVELLAREKIPYVVIELNAQNCERAAAGGAAMICGSAADVKVLEQAEIRRATLVALMVPNDEIVLAAISHIRELNGTAHIIARCSFTSTGLEAVRRGADRSIVAEQVIARELTGITAELLKIRSQ
jgi:D-arabinose 1-dehydrogenase-like Zn-dependent alcohol dehydrogenase